MKAATGRIRQRATGAMIGMLVLLSPAAPAAHAALRNGLALTPYMGVNTWYVVGTRVDEATVVTLADAMVRRGLLAAGYRYLWIDGGWWGGARDSQGKIVTSPAQWPRGMRWLTKYLHSRGLRAGIYTDAGATGCASTQGGSYGHYQSDVDTFAAWGFDAVKVDFCGGHAMRLDPRVAYRRFGAAILADRPHRRMLFNVCDANPPDEFGPGRPPYGFSAYAAYTFAPAIANSWRNSRDIGQPGHVVFAGVLANLDRDALHPEVAGPGHWNDPDYLVPGEGMTPSQSRAQFTMWTILAAPLMLSFDVRTAPAWIAKMVTEREAIAIDQDRLGIQGRLASKTGRVQVWVKRLAHRALAVALLNRQMRMRTAHMALATLGLRRKRRYRIRDVWARRTTITTGGLTLRVPGNGAVLLKVSRL